MKFKNYKNSYTKDNRIYSFNDVYNMSVGELLKCKEELLSQYRVLGVPTEKELQSSENVVYVHAYTKDDGTQVKSHYRSKPDGDVSNNFSTESTTSKAASLSQNLSFDKPIAGVKRGKPMTFEKATGGRCNPNYYESEQYWNNCTGCVIALEARLRGYAVRASEQNFTGKLQELALNPFNAWLDKKGEICKGTELESNTSNECVAELEKIVQPGQRYNFVYYTEIEQDGEDKTEGHVVSIDRDEKGNLRWYDPQSDRTKQGEIIEGSIEALVSLNNPKLRPKILRVDDKIINSEYADSALVPD